MHIRLVFILFILAACIISPQTVPAAEAEKAPQTQSARSKNIFGPPVNVNISGPGTVPEGVLYTAINASFADKVRNTRNARGDRGRPSDTFQQLWLLKLRYGITDYLEIVSVTPYVNQRITNPEPKRYSTIYGLMDSTLYFALAPWQERRGDPFTASISAGVWLPVGAWGRDNPPGYGVAGFRGQAAVGKWLNKDIKIETEGVWSSTRFASGNQDVRLGDQFQWNSQIRYLFNYFDIGLESTLIWQLNSHRERTTSRYASGDMRNSSTEWFVGPSVNVAIEPLDMWVGLGAFFAAMQRFQGVQRKVENVRFEFKIGKLW